MGIIFWMLQQMSAIIGLINIDKQMIFQYHFTVYSFIDQNIRFIVSRLWKDSLDQLITRYLILRIYIFKDKYILYMTLSMRD